MVSLVVMSPSGMARQEAWDSFYPKFRKYSFLAVRPQQSTPTRAACTRQQQEQERRTVRPCDHVVE